MKAAIHAERTPDERRVALGPDTGTKLIAAKLEVSVEAGAGAEAFITDDAYQAAGAKLVKSAADLLKDADAVLKVQAPDPKEVDLLRNGAVLISFRQPATQGDFVKSLANRVVPAFAL